MHTTFTMFTKSGHFHAVIIINNFPLRNREMLLWWQTAPPPPSKNNWDVVIANNRFFSRQSWTWFVFLSGGPGAVVKVVCLEIAGLSSTQDFTFQRSKMFLLRSLVKNEYCGEPPWPRGSVLSLRPSGLKFRILCLESSIISFITPSSGCSPGQV